MAEVELLQLHDARLEEAVLRLGGSALLRFAHVTVYERKAPELYDVVSYGAEAVCTGVTDMHCVGAFDDWSKISSLLIDGTELSSAEETALLHAEHRSSANVALVFFGGARIELACARISFRLQQRGRVIEVWEGPL